MPLPLAVVFADLIDPRRETANKRHQLTDILTVAVCAVLSGADGWEQMAEYGRRKEAFFRRFLALPHGIPSHDTFYRVFAALDPDAFAAAFGRWMAAACEGTGLVPVAVDGKAVRGAVRGNATGCLCVVSAWATENRLTLGQVVVPDGTSEIGVIPDLLRTLDLAGAIVTLDAAGCQVGNADLIREQGGHYLLAVKGNQPGLDEAVRAVFDRACEADFAGVRYDTHEDVEGGHGRREERYATVVYAPAGLPEGWAEAAAVVQVNRVREENGERTETTHRYITSHGGSAAELAGFVRGHWGIENPQPDCWRSDNLCVTGRTGYHRPGGPVRVGRVVRPTSRPRRRPMSARDPLVPPRASVRRGRLFRRRSGTNSRPSSGGSCSGSSPTYSPDRS